MYKAPNTITEPVLEALKELGVPQQLIKKEIKKGTDYGDWEALYCLVINRQVEDHHLSNLITEFPEIYNWMQANCELRTEE